MHPKDSEAPRRKEEMLMTNKKIAIISDKIAAWSLYILIFCLPFSKSIIEICIVVGILAVITKKISNGDYALKPTPLNLALAVYLIAGLLSLWNAQDKFFVTRAIITKLLKFIALYFVIVETIDTDTKLKDLLRMAFISIIIITADCFIQYYITHRDILHNYRSFKYTYDITWKNPFYLGFPTGPFPFPNDLSAWALVLFLPLICVFLFGRQGAFRRLIDALVIMPLLYIFYLANTRSAWFGFAISSLFVLISNKKFIMIFIMALIVLALIPLLPMEKLGDIVGMTSMADRAGMWNTGWIIFLDHPIIGSGLNTFFGKFMEYREDEWKGKKGSYAHNGYLQIAADTGLIGLLGFLAIIFSAFFSVFRYIKNEKDAFYKSISLGIAAGILAFLIQAGFDTNLQSLPLVSLFWFALGVMMSVVCMRDKDMGICDG